MIDCPLNRLKVRRGEQLPQSKLTEADAKRIRRQYARYKALGNSMAVPVMHWIGERISFIGLNLQPNHVK